MMPRQLHPPCLAVAIAIFACLLPPTSAVAADTAGLSKQSVQQACESSARQQGLDVGDFGDTEFNAKQGYWVSMLRVRGSGEKFKARCEWDGKQSPKLTVAENSQNILSMKYTRQDVNNRCKQQALSQGMEVGDFGDTNWDKKSQQWQAILKVAEDGVKRKTSCTWDGVNKPVIH